ncbi:3-hydroxyanthranilate 3,4-dioxygenase [Stenotrophomonas sp. C3(2023)]|uniref:3-hydroxyanthranilate 3,4-dioxygenase n=1 Tax=Stenotrophomonas sp. C3(2023) TaxID=3080277 RepID=UPI00293C5C98|nr:3-hydroxyanthranilate 3,4-dioxygenase [Stenotrophomonas sp. C3(2023)]MDV3468381.1 3-hydroxyanthranilate 3,4-dioxygenase [Stenotrophomonas sp. C3(2023)]
MLATPLNLQAWIEENRHLLKPPVGNKMIENGDFIVMVVGGPNARTDYHIDEGPEWFYQLEGEMVLKVQHEGAVQDITIRAGEIFLLPGGVPHSPRRPAGGVGLVVERRRLPHERDGVVWHCERCNHKLHEQFFHLQNIETDLPALFARYQASEALRTCDNCGHLDPLPTPG